MGSNIYPQPAENPTVSVRNLSVHYGSKCAVKGVDLDFHRHRITALIGPSGCGKSTLLRSINRMNELIPNCRTSGSIYFEGVDIVSPSVDPIDVRFKVGMVFQQPNPFPKSIFDNVAFGLKINNIKVNLKEAVEEALHKAALWDEVKDRLDESGLSLSGGQQQRLCIARALAVKPSVLLLDEPASALDPISTQHIEELLRQLRQEVTIVIVTHNMQQATRVSDYVAVMMSGEDQIGQLIEYGTNRKIFDTPEDSRTEAYVTGRIG